MLFSDALEGYWLEKERDFSPNTVADYSLTFARFQAYLAPEPGLEEVTSDDVRGFLNELRQELDLSRKSLANAWTALSSFWSWAELELGVDHVIRGRVARPRYRRPQVQPYTKDEVKALLDACDTYTGWNPAHGRRIEVQRPTALRDRALMMVLLDTGIRVSELAALTLNDYDRKRGQLTIREGKGDKLRTVFLGHGGRRALWRYMAQDRRQARPDEAIFAVSDGRPMDRHNIRKIIKRAGDRAGVPQAGPHRFRHTFAINFLRNGGNLLALQQLLGHERMETVRIYAKLATVDIAQAMSVASPADNWGL